MTPVTLRSTAIASALLTTTWTLAAGAEQPRAAAEPTPPRAVEPVRTSPVVTDPMMGVETERESLPNTPLLVTGTVVLGATYGASVIGAQTSDRDAYDKLYYPVAGPWLALDDRNCDADPCSDETLGTTLLIGSGILQGVGALSMVMSLFIPQETTRSWYLIGNEDVVVAPVMNASTVGAAAVGRF